MMSQRERLNKMNPNDPPDAGDRPEPAGPAFKRSVVDGMLHDARCTFGGDCPVPGHPDQPHRLPVAP